MEALVKSLESLFLGSVPTILLFLLLYIAYRTLVHVPLQRVLKERYDRTAGAMARAKSDIAKAAARTDEYEQKLREAKAGIFKAQEQRKQQMIASREAALAEARQRAQKMVRDAQAALEKDLSESRTRLRADAESLAAEVVRSVLKPVAAGARGGM